MDEGGHLHAEVSAESRAGWQHFADEHDVTLAAVAEAVGLSLGAGLPEPVMSEIASIAVEVAAERRSRRR